MENHWVVPVATTGSVLVGMFAIAWRSRARALARRLAALNSYAERQISQERHRKALRRLPGPSSPESTTTSITSERTG